MQSRKLPVKRTGTSRKTNRSRFSIMSPSSARAVPLTVRRRRRRLIVFGFVVFALVLLVGALAWASRAPVFTIQGVEVRGTHTVSKDALKAAAEGQLSTAGFALFSKRSMFLYPEKTIEKQILEIFPRVKTVEASLTAVINPSLSLSVAEREPFALWCEDVSTCFFLDDEGVLFAPSTFTQKKMPIFYGGMVGEVREGTSFLPTRFLYAITLINELEKREILVKSFTVLHEDDFEIKTKEGVRLVIGFDQQIEDVASNAETALESETLEGKVKNIEYVDLRFGNRVYYKLKEE